jgi:hypothetical protein
MTKLELMRVASKGYPDGMLSEYYDDKGNYTPQSDAGDGLAKFVVAELSETFDPGATDAAQIKEAVRVLVRAEQDLQDTIVALRGGLTCRQ